MPFAKATTQPTGIPTKSVFIFQNTSLAVVVLCFTACLVYWPTLFNNFQNFWDDQWVVMNRYTEAGLSWDNLRSILTEYYNGQYAPLNQFHYTLLYTLVGYDPFWFHAVALLIHVTNVVLVYFFIVRLLQYSQYFTDASLKRIALITALLMAVHPFLTEAIVWSSASKVIIYVLFYLLALHGYLTYLNTRKAIHYLLSIVLFIFSFGGKEQAITLPVCLLLLDYVLQRDFKTKTVWLEKIPFFLIAIGFGFMALFAEAEVGEGLLAGERNYPFYQNIIFASYTYIEYFIKCLLPVKLSYLYPFPNEIGDPVPWRFWMYPFILVFVVASLFNFWMQRWVFFGIAFFTIHIALVIHLIPLSRFAIVADRYVYLAAVGVFFLVAYFIDKAILHRVKYLKFVLATALLYLLALGAYAHERTKVWRSTDSLKEELRELLKKRNDFEKVELKSLE
jgi:hypothetical protein